MKRGDAGLGGDGLVEGGDVAETDDRPRVAADGVVVDAVEDAHDAVAAAGEEDGVDRVIAQGAVQLREANVIRAGEVAAMALPDVRGDGDAKAARLDRSGGRLDARTFGGTRRSNDGDVSARQERARSGQGRHSLIVDR